MIFDSVDGEPADVCWVVGDSGVINISINDARLAEERLQTARRDHGLSPSRSGSPGTSSPA